MWLDASLPEDDDPSDETALRRPSTLLNAAALGNVGTGKSAVQNSLTGHPVLPTGENHATRIVGNPDAEESGVVVCW
jgi:dynamin 1/3|uniref:Dynamin N-terminal domain-containing protein n=1 Tax=Zea mays TaxID=4577 RepID=A0A804MHS3_MAIZE